MYDQFRWTAASARRNRLTMEFEPLQPHFLFALAEKAGCGTFLDIGANIGAYSLFATLVPTIDRIVAFEADPQTLEELKSNISLNGLGDRIDIQGKAVSSAAGKLSFGVVGKLSGANSVIDTSIHDRSAFHDQLTVEAVSLDGYFTNPWAHPICMKIDVEGHEREVIDGAAAMLTASKALVQMEAYDAENANGRSLEELGYVRLTGIGPDHYFTNIDGLNNPAVLLAAYERTARELIAFNHRSKPLVLERGEFSVQLAGRSATMVRNLKRKLTRHH